MGLFVTDEGHYSGWLAALLCCFAALNDDEYPAERQKDLSRSLNRTGVCNEQPAKTASPSLPATSGDVLSDAKSGDLAVHEDSRYNVRESPKQSDLCSSSLFPRWPPMDVDESRASVPGRVVSPTTQRQGLVPLRLGPVVLRDCAESGAQPTAYPVSLSTGPHAAGHRNRSDSTQELLEDTTCGSYRDDRETPFQRCSRRSTDLLATSRSSLPSSSPVIASSKESGQLKPTMSNSSSSASLRRQAMETNALSASDRFSGTRLKRKRSDQSARRSRASPENPVIEQEVLELNTIVEERRAQTSRGRPSDGHIPAVAPSMEVRARSKTLDDIGSAFSRPLDTRAAAPVGLAYELDRNPCPFITPRKANRSSSRVSGWLSNIITTSNSTPSLPMSEPFYKCRPPSDHTRSTSRASTCSSVTVLESPSLTLASSPTTVSKGHSRNLTTESKLPPLSPLEKTYELDEAELPQKAAWPVTTDRSDEVGLAL